MPSDDLKHHATSDTDFYSLLGITFETSQKDIDRAWRRTALKYHPDKVGNANIVAREQFHLAQIGYDLLSDPASKAIYDNARSARLQRKRQNELFEGRRRQMKDDLEMRERGGGVKRPRDEGEVEEERLQMEIRRLAEDGKRRRREREEALRRDLERESTGATEEMQKKSADDGDGAGDGSSAQKKKKDSGAMPGPPITQGVADIDRTVKVRWPVDGEGGSITADRVKDMFSRFGKIDSADLLSPKMLRLSGSKKKQLAVVCMVQYSSVVGAHAAVEDFWKLQQGGGGGGSAWTVFDSVSWAANKEPDFINNNNDNGSQQRNGEGTMTPETPSTPASGLRKSSTANPFAYLQTPGSDTTPNSSSPAAGGGGGDSKKKPSFASFSPPAAASNGTRRGSPFGKGGLGGPNSPSLEELTMIRLKEAEKRRLAAEIQRQDDEADAAKEANGG